MLAELAAANAAFTIIKKAVQNTGDIAKAGKGKGAVGVTVTNAAKNYVVLLELDGYSEVSYNGSVVVP